MNTPNAESYEDRLNRERRERRETAETAARDVSAAMTTATGEDWSGKADAENYSPRYTLKRYRDGLTVEASLSTHKRPAAWHTYAGSITSGDGARLWLNEHKRRDEETSANIGQQKTAAQVARDIIRRVLPIAEELARRALDARKLELERKAWLETTAAQMVDATRERMALRPSHHDEKSTRRELRHWGKPYVTLTLDAYDRLTKLEVDDIPPAVALAMLAQIPAVAPEPEEVEV